MVRVQSGTFRKGRKLSCGEQNRSLIISLYPGIACTNAHPNTRPPTLPPSHTQRVISMPSITAPLLHPGFIFHVLLLVPAVACDRRISFRPTRNNKTKQSNSSLALSVGAERSVAFVGLASRKVLASRVISALMNRITQAQASSPVSASSLMAELDVGGPVSISK